MESTQNSVGATSPQVAPIPPTAVGSPCDFNAFQTRTQKSVFISILRRVGRRNFHAAEDLTQDAFVNAFQAWSTFDPSISEVAWIITIADRLVTDYFRSNRTAKRYHESEPLFGEIAYSREKDPLHGHSREKDPHEQLAEEEEEAEHHRRLNAAIERLSVPERLLINLSFAECSYEEIAEHTGRSPSAVGAALTRLREKLTQMLRGCSDASQQ